MNTMTMRRRALCCQAAALLLAISACGGGSAGATPEASTTVATPTPTPTPTPTTTGMRSLTSTQLAAQMGVGWNLGNSLEAIGGETAWGNPRTREPVEITMAFLASCFSSLPSVVLTATEFLPVIFAVPLM